MTCELFDTLTDILDCERDHEHKLPITHAEAQQLIDEYVASQDLEHAIERLPADMPVAAHQGYREMEARRLLWIRDYGWKYAR